VAKAFIPCYSISQEYISAEFRAEDLYTAGITQGLDTGGQIDHPQKLSRSECRVAIAATGGHTVGRVVGLTFRLTGENVGNFRTSTLSWSQDWERFAFRSLVRWGSMR
jgi:hypothetical protein